MITCVDCGTDVERTGRNQKRCGPCRVSGKGKRDHASRVRTGKVHEYAAIRRERAHGGHVPPRTPSECEICGDVALLVVDHDHACCDTRNTSCGACFRGFICRHCNTALGLFRDSPDRMRAAIAYLQKGQAA